jgi:hypothetical protein
MDIFHQKFINVAVKERQAMARKNSFRKPGTWNLKII